MGCGIKRRVVSISAENTELIHSFFIAFSCFYTVLVQKAQLSLTKWATLFCKVVEVLQDFLSENVDKKFTTDYNVA